MHSHLKQLLVAPQSVSGHQFWEPGPCQKVPRHIGPLGTAPLQPRHGGLGARAHTLLRHTRPLAGGLGGAWRGGSHRGAVQQRGELQRVLSRTDIESGAGVVGDVGTGIAGFVAGVGGRVRRELHRGRSFGRRRQ